MKAIVCSCLLVCLLAGCSKDKSDPTDASTRMTIEFDNIVGGQNLFLNTTTYTNASGENFTVSSFRYFISNISLRRTDGSIYIVPQDSSYFLIDEELPASRFARFPVPSGDYDRLSYIIGVDSMRSTMDISQRTGVLDPTGGHDGMYWGWNSGYIFLKMEGISSVAPVDPTGQHKFRFHIGGYGGYNTPGINNLKTVTIDLRNSGIAQPRAGREANVHILVDAMKVMDGGTTISIAAHPTVMLSDYSKTVAANYQAMFYHDHTEN